MRSMVLVFFGGGLGSLLRYLVNRRISEEVVSAFPYGTFVVNVTGCFLIGFLVFFTERYGAQAQQWRLFLVTGICGGYTTFSSFSFENSQLITDHRILVFLTYSIGSLALGLVATYFGIWTGKHI